MSNEIVLKTKNLKKKFGSLVAVEDISLNVERGQVYGFLGPNGAGKTTTIGMILGLLHPTAGSVSLFGEPVSPGKTNPLRRVGALIGAPALVPYLSGYQNLELLARLTPGLSKRRIAETLEIVGLEGAAKRQAGNFSTGMKQRLGLAMALVHEPELLILDEPTNGLDPAGMREIRVLLTQLADQGMTIFISSHLLHEIEQICDRVAVLKSGRVVAEGGVKNLLGDQEIVRVRVSEPHRAVQLLSSLPGVGEVVPNGAFITVSGASGEAVVSRLASQGIFPSEVTTGRPDLESIFLELTQTDTN